MLKVALVDDSPAVQASLGRVLALSRSITVVGVAADVDSAIALVQRTRPDVVVLDVELRNNETSMPVLRFVRSHRPSTRVVMLSNWSCDAVRAAYLAAGADAYFDKSTEFLKARDWIAAQGD